MLPSGDGGRYGRVYKRLSDIHVDMQGREGSESESEYIY